MVVEIVPVFKQDNIYPSALYQIVFKLSLFFFPVWFIFKFVFFESTSLCLYCARTLSVSAETKASLEDQNIRMDNGIEARTSHSHQKGINSCHVLSVVCLCQL